MSSKTARRNRRESSQVGATISRLPGLPPPRGKQAGLSPLFQPPGRAKLHKQRLSGRPRTRPHEGRAGSPRPFPASAAAAPPPRARSPAPRPGRGRSRGLLALAAHSPGSCGTPGAQPLGNVQPRTGPSARLPRCVAPFRPTRTLQSLSGAMAVPQPLLSLRPSDSALAKSTQQKGSGQAALGAVSGAGVGRGRSSSQRGVAAGPPATLIAARCCRLSRSVCSVAPFGGARLPPPGAVSKADGVFFASCAMAEGAAGTGLRAERSGFRGHSLAVGTTQPAAAGRARCRTGAFPRPTALPWPRSFFSSSCSRFPSKPCEPPLRVCSRPPWWSPASGLTGAAPKGAAARGGSPARRMAP